MSQINSKIAEYQAQLQIKNDKKRVSAISDGDPGCHLFNSSYEISRF